MLKILESHMMNHHMVAAAGGRPTSCGPAGISDICLRMYFLFLAHRHQLHKFPQSSPRLHEFPNGPHDFPKVKTVVRNEEFDEKYL